MSIADWLMILAVFLGPIFAVRVSRFLDIRRESRERKIHIFKTLMATRAYNVSWSHVEALNRIDLEFSRKNAEERVVLDAWKAYLDLLGTTGISQDQWGVKRVELLVELLHSMAVVLDYDFDKTHIKNSSYSPQVHGDTELDQKALRKLLLEVLHGNRSIPMRIAEDHLDHGGS